MPTSNIIFTENAQQQTLNSIQSLQNLEKQLYADLEKLSAKNASSESQQLVINKINDISKTRIALFQQLQASYLTLQDNVSDKRNDLVDQLALVKIVENELDNAKSQINTLKNSNTNNLRMTEINTYYSKKYAAHSKIMKFIILFCIPLLVLAILSKRYIISPYIAKFIGIFIVIFGVFYIGPMILDLYRRNNMVYDEYNFPFNPKNIPTINEEAAMNKEHASAGKKPLCIGASCCSTGMTYDDTKEICVVTKSGEKESFISGQSTQNPGSLVSDSYIYTNPFTVNRL